MTGAIRMHMLRDNSGGSEAVRARFDEYIQK